MLRQAILGAFLAACLSAVGCQQQDARTAELRSKYVLAQEPAGAESIETALEKAKQSQSEDLGEVVLVGRIGAGEFDPWAAGQASFLMSEAIPETDHADAPGHDPANCPFCRRRAEKAASFTALVQFHDDQGEVVPIDARQLLGVEQNQVVVVHGKARLDKAGALIVAADGIHIRR
jgi:hypothetical protein